MPALRFATATDLYEAFATARQDISAPAGAEHPLAFLRALAAGEKPFDAISFGAYLLPRHDAVRWAVECLRLVSPRDVAAPDPALKAASAWLAAPEEENRLAALRHGMQDEPRAPSTWIALAAGWAGPTVPLDERHPVPAQPWMTARAVRAGIALVLAGVPPRERGDVLQSCVRACLALVEDRGGSSP
jgi:hypothetical protein